MARRYVRADFRGGEHLVPYPANGLAARETLNSYLESSRASRWFGRWFWAGFLVVGVFSFIAVAVVLFTGRPPLGVALLLAGFDLVVLAFVVHLQAGVRCMFRHRHARQRPRRR